MKKYIEAYKKYITLFVVIVFAIALFVVHSNNNFNTILEYAKTSILMADNDAKPTVKIDSRKYYSSSGEINEADAYRNKLDRIELKLTTTVVDNKDQISVTIKRNNSDVTNKFNIEKSTSGNKSTIKIKLKNDQSYDYDQNYTVEVKATVGSQTSETKTYNFKVKDKYYNLEAKKENMDLTSGSGTTRGVSEWTAEFKNVENIDFSKIEIESIKTTSLFGLISVDHTNKFEISNRDSANNKITIRMNSNDYFANTYNVVFKYSNTSYSNARGTLKINFKFDIRRSPSPTMNLVEEESSSNRLIRNIIFYKLKRVTNDNVTISIDNVDSTLSRSDFEFKYTGVNIDALLLDNDGYILYPFTGTVVRDVRDNTVYFYQNGAYSTLPLSEFTSTYGTPTSAQGVVVKNVIGDEVYFYPDYYNRPNYIEHLPLNSTAGEDSFVSRYGVFDTNTYEFADNHIYMKINGTQRNFDSRNLTIFATGGGQIINKYNYTGVDKRDFETADIIITHIADGNYSNEEFVVYKHEYEHTNMFSRYEGHYKDEVYYDSSFQFEITELTNNTIKYKLLYDNTDDRYKGIYEIRFKFTGNDDAVLRFTLEDAPVDFVLTASVDTHDGTTEQMTTPLPPANMRYEYYLALRMIKGTVDPSNVYSKDNLITTIYSKRADLDNNGNIYFYDQVDYTIRIKNYKNNQITYEYSTDEADFASEKTYITRTETLNGNSDFEKKYYHAYNLLSYYQFDANGDLITTSDNYPYSITNISRINNINYVTFKRNGININVPFNQYVTSGGNEDTLVNSFEYLEYKANGDVDRGVINGFYVSNTYPYSDSYDVTDQFDITYSDSTNDIEHAIKVLPKVEVEPGTYYPYIYYNSELIGVGYLNNGSDGREVIVTKNNYPEYWDRNTHMTMIRYQAPLYEVELTNLHETNSANTDDIAYYNIPSAVYLNIIPKYIYNYDDIHYLLEYTTNGTTWNTVDTSKYTISFATMNEDGTFNPIDNFAYHDNDDSEYYLFINLSENMTKGTYRLTASYTNPDNDISLISNPTVTFDLNSKYYGFVFDKNNSDELDFPHNYSLTRKIQLKGYYVGNPENVTTNIYYLNNGERLQLTQNGNQYSFVNNGTSTLFFTESKSYTNNPDGTLAYTVNLTNIADATQIGDYIYEVIYQEGDNPRIVTDVDFKVSPDKYIINLANEYPRASDVEMSFAKDITTQYIPEELLDDIKFTFLYWDERRNNYVDVSSNEVAAADKHIYNVIYEDVNCSNSICSGKVRFYINRNKVDMEGDYLLQVRYNNEYKEYEVTNFKDMFAWDIASSSITSVYNYVEDGVNKSKVVDGFFNNLDDIQINVELNNDINSNNISYSINKSCITDPICIPSADQYSDLFNVTNTTGTDKTIKFVPKRDASNNVRIQSGTYALILYYEETFYKEIDFVVHSEYASITYNNITMKSTYSSNGIEEQVDGLYAQLNGYLSADTYVEGVPYESVNRYIINSMGQVVSAFVVNTPSDFATTHISVANYSPVEMSVVPGIYTYITEYVAHDNDIIQAEPIQFTVYDEYFDFDIYDVENTPNPLVINKSGTALFKIRAKNIPYLIYGEDGDRDHARVDTFRDNSKMYDYDGNDVTYLFNFETVRHQDTLVSGEFDIKASFAGVTLPMGPYRYETSYTIGNRTITKDYWIVIDESDRYIIINNVDINSKTPDNIIHNSDGGSFIINYTANTDRAYEDIDVQITSDDENITDKFNITIEEDKIIVEYDPTDNPIDEGYYNANITYAGNVDIVQLHIYGEYIAIPALTSSRYKITYGDDPIIYIDSLSSLSIKYSTFVSFLNNKQPNGRLINRNGSDVTSASTSVGTGMKYINPGDNTYTIVLIGDLNQDGNISLSDVAYLYNYYKGTLPTAPNKYVLKAADIRKQNNITLSDVAKLYNFYTRTITSL